MKKILIILFVMMVSLGASAQKRYTERGSHPTRSHVIVTYGWPYHYYWYYSPFYYPYYPYEFNRHESRLEIKIDGIRSKYQDKIWSTRHDKSLDRAKRKELIHQLKYERDMAINKAKEEYYSSH